VVWRAGRVYTRGGGVFLVAALAVLVFGPETKGKVLEEICA
jgi:drug/metabolite transporter superfamily protein YnfA